MKERPILFSAPMVIAILEGRKTMTRRICKKQPEPHHWQRINGYKLHQKTCLCTDVLYWRYQHTVGRSQEDPVWVKCPYGQVGDHLWVRENFILDVAFDDLSPAMVHETKEILYTSDNVPFDYWHGKNRQSIFMPRWASRITLEITGIRVERLNDISEEDAQAEGIIDGGCLNCGNDEPCNCSDPRPSAKDSFIALWGSINGAGSWDINPYVWVIEFKRISTC